MKNIFCLILFICYCASNYAQRGIGTNTPNASSILELKSSNKGVLLSRLTQAQRDAIQNPAEGLIVYCTDCSIKGLYIYINNWLSIRGIAIGDIKQSIQISDHKGWVKLDGRALNELTTSQKANAMNQLGMTTHLPNTTETYITQSKVDEVASKFGKTLGNNYLQLKTNHLPKITLNTNNSTPNSTNITINDYVLDEVKFKGVDESFPFSDSQEALFTTNFSYHTTGGISGTKYGLLLERSSRSATNIYAPSEKKITTNHSHIHNISFNQNNFKNINTTPKSFYVNTFIFLGN